MVAQMTTVDADNTIESRASQGARDDLLLDLSNVSKRFPGVVALDGVDFDLRRGEVHVLFGENGAGKSTLMAVAAGALVPEEGRIVIGGVESKFVVERREEAGGVSRVLKFVQQFMDVPCDGAGNVAVADAIG